MKLQQLLFAALTSTVLAAPLVEERACTPQGNGGGLNENGVVNNNCCTDVTIIFARGTAEFGNVGTFAGPPFFKSLRAKLGASRVTVQGVNYPADLLGLATLGAAGSPDLASKVRLALSQCSKTQIVLSGYSQGAEVVHDAFLHQGLSAIQAKAAVLFGDPFNGAPAGNLSSEKLREICAPGDLICETDTLIATLNHLTYGRYADQAASWVISALGL
ncbi:cutinase-domain-containing protein [Venturia nashicola]|nr:cutinase-domain-containing protein [Venturia nashicola]